MPIFPKLILEALVQENDKTRLDASKSYASGTTATTLVIEIQPDTDEEFYDVSATGYLDWQYVISEESEDDPETKTITLRVTNDDGEETITGSIQVVSATVDKLFSSDDNLRKHEPDILKYLPDGRASFLDVHRRSQRLILDWLDREGFIDNLGDKITLARITDTEEVFEWSTMMTLRLIFEGLVSEKEDVFDAKATKYLGLENFYRGRAVLRIDLNQDGATDATEHLDIRSARVVRR